MTEVHTRGGTVGADFRTITGLGRESKGCYLQLCRVLAGGEPAGWSLLLSVQHSLTFLQDHGVAELGAELPCLVANCRTRCRTAVLGGCSFGWCEPWSAGIKQPLTFLFFSGQEADSSRLLSRLFSPTGHRKLGRNHARRRARS
ncbi:uncharacterized protein LOC121803989 [Salvia splendens]|uniref:uncharacterized protein LOC121803989 n=1 Tax=Salvia splendens TaxID=180675 RepID=UPI001C2746F5|nr:uncharacterized protein LOC121803989 [Salvia splendens]